VDFIGEADSNNSKSKMQNVKSPLLLEGT